MTALKKNIKNSSLFRKIYIIDLFFCTVSFLQIAAYVLLVFIFIWGVFLTINNQRQNKTLLNLRFGVWLNAFLLVSLLSVIINLFMNPSATILLNLLMLFHVCICFMIFYGMNTEPSLNFKEELYDIASCIVYITTVVNIISIVCLLTDIRFEWYWIKFTIYENRFTGVYMNPNNMGFNCIAAMLCCHILYKKSFIDRVKKEPVNNIVMALCVITSVFSLMLCDSNAAIVLGIAYVFIYIVCRFFANRPSSTARLVTKLASLLLIAVFLVSATLFIRAICQEGFSAVVSKTTSIVSILAEENSADANQGSGTAKKPTQPKKNVTFSHENKNIDSGRAKLWLEGAELYKLSPIIGISNGNIIAYSQKKLSGALSYSYHLSDLHNGFLTLLVSTGIVGFILFAIFGLRFIACVSKILFMRRNSFYADDALPCIFSFLFAYLFYAMFEKALLYDISFIVMFFWLMMGYAGCYIKKYKHIDDGLNIKEFVHSLKRQPQKQISDNSVDAEK